jgi:hypothetical protein
MIGNLRKGQSCVYLQYANIGETIGAKQFEAERRGNVVVLRFTLNPVDGNQRSDEERLHSDTLLQVHLADNYIIENLNDFLDHWGQSASALELEIISKGRKLRFSLELGSAGMNMLPLIVKPIAD